MAYSFFQVPNLACKCGAELDAMKDPFKLLETALRDNLFFPVLLDKTFCQGLRLNTLPLLIELPVVHLVGGEKVLSQMILTGQQSLLGVSSLFDDPNAQARCQLSWALS